MARCSSVGSLMGMEYDPDATGGDYNETPRQKQLIPESSNLSGHATKRILVAQGPRLLRIRSLKSELIIGETYQRQSTSAKAREEPLRSSLIKALKKAQAQDRHLKTH